MHTSQEESQYNPEFYQHYYESQDPQENLKLEEPSNTLEYDTTLQECPQIIPFHVNSDHQQCALSERKMSLSFTPRRRAQSQGYGKLTFIQKPDQLGNYNIWSLQERQDNRRIIAFHKMAHGDIIQLNCFAIPAQEYKENMITISCIRWIPNLPHELQHKYARKCVFTSVDIILLLERVVGKSFTVQEKNRIRRNLEGFHPETVKKEGITNRFFNQVMSYAHPKTRNIEKDIKVFLWSDITRALRKVFQKYHANGGISLGRTTSETTLSFNREPQQLLSSTESLPTHCTFMDTDYSQPILEGSWQHSLTASSSQDFTYENAIFATSQEETSVGDSSSSISPQSEVSQLGVPVEFEQVVSRSSMDGGQQALDGYLHGIPEGVHF